jgi:biopolymer transport protein ExbB/TolQ
MFQWMNRPAQIIVIALLLMLICAIGIAIKQFLNYQGARKQTKAFGLQFGNPLHCGDFDKVLCIAERYNKSHVARLAAAGLVPFASPTALSDNELIERTRRTLRNSKRTIYAEMKRGLAPLVTIGSTAPLIGFFGTAVGIFGAFRGCVAEKWVCISATFEGVSDAVAPAALGLLVAVPVIWLYSYLATTMNAFDNEMEYSSLELMNHIILHLKRTQNNWAKS